MAHDPYIDPETGILRNLIGATDASVFAKKEFTYSAIRATELKISPIEGNFDLHHLKALHQHLFRDVYDWAGDIRTIGMSKDEPLLGGHLRRNTQHLGHRRDHSLFCVVQSHGRADRHDAQ